MEKKDSVFGQAIFLLIIYLIISHGFINKEYSLLNYSIGSLKSILLRKDGKNYGEGEWKDVQINGNGTRFYKSGSRYQGFFKDGKINGNGTYFLNDGKMYEGEWKDEKMDGKGTLLWNNRNSYEGEWKDGKINVNRTFFLNNVNIHE